MEWMKDKPDNYYDLAIVDPPYGIGQSGGAFRDRKGRGNHRVHIKKQWDNETPTELYFIELQRVALHQIVWGGNYFTDKLPASRCWLYWDKLMGGDFSDGELAWTSFDAVLKKFTKCNKMHGKTHPTEKPQPGNYGLPIHEEYCTSHHNREHRPYIYPDCTNPFSFRP